MFFNTYAICIFNTITHVVLLERAISLVASPTRARDIHGRISNAKTIMKQLVSRTYINVVFCDDYALGLLVADRR